jgi:hypothetical protein
MASRQGVDQSRGENYLGNWMPSDGHKLTRINKRRRSVDEDQEAEASPS